MFSVPEALGMLMTEVEVLLCLFGHRAALTGKALVGRARPWGRGVEGSSSPACGTGGCGWLERGPAGAGLGDEDLHRVWRPHAHSRRQGH